MPAIPNEPPGDPPTDPSVDDRITLDESLNRLLVVLLKSLTPAERVAFVLHDVLGVPFRTISDIVGRSPDASRTLARSARRQIRHRRDDKAQRDRESVLVHRALQACAAGNQRQLERFLDPEITVVIDGGRKARAIDVPGRGIEGAAQLLIRLFAKAPTTVVSEQSINGQVGLVFRDGSRVVGVVSLNLRAELIFDVWIVANPDKLRHWNSVTSQGVHLPGHCD